MPSSFSWLDYSEHDRRRTLDVVDMFRERDSRDELGIGTVRDAFADLLFPGTSTIQTRGRYFLFIPWIYQKLEQQRVSSSQIAQKARISETKLIKALQQQPDDTLGIIGARAGGAVKRLASNVYWQGLGVWGVRLHNVSQDQYYRSLDDYYRKQKGCIVSDDGEFIGKKNANWLPLPPAPNGFPKNASFRLSPEESRFLIECILTRCSGSLLAFLVDRDTTLTKANTPWELPEVAELPYQLQEQLDHARNFSITIYGAALLYNLILAEKANSENRIEEYQSKMENWLESLNNHENQLVSWDRPRFWAILDGTNARIPRLTRKFIDQWLDWVLNEPETLATSDQARSFIADRERHLKGNKSRIYNPRALEMWSGAAGAYRLDYRWFTVQTIIDDILQGVTAEVEHA